MFPKAGLPGPTSRKAGARGSAPYARSGVRLLLRLTRLPPSATGD